jgi:peptidoglycan hydrolase-like protein with peptidoglycan-binding domain
MSQWGSQHMALQGATPIQILRHYYPNDVQLVESTNFKQQSTSSYPGTALRQGSSGASVRMMQIYLNRISGNFWIPPIGTIDGIFGPRMRETVVAFQRQFNLTPDGVIGRSTWYEIIRVYVAVRQLAELTSEGQRIGISLPVPTQTINMGDRGELVVLLQFLLNMASEFYEDIPWVIENGIFRTDTQVSVVAFQKKYGLTPDGVVGPATWRELYEVYDEITNSISQTPFPPGGTPFPGTPLQVGSTGENVFLIQTYLRAIHGRFPNIPLIAADGVFGPRTEAAVIAFQREFGLAPDGVVGSATWSRINEVFASFINGGTPPRPPGVTVPGPYPGTALRVGSRGNDVVTVQRALNDIAARFPAIPALNPDGSFGPLTQASVMAFQRIFGLNPDGVVGPLTWGMLVRVLSNWSNVPSPPPYPGELIRVGSRGNNVMTVQRQLNAISSRFPSVATLNVDGVFGPRTEASVIAFQRAVGIADNGIVGPITWAWMTSVNNGLPYTGGSTAASIEANTAVSGEHEITSTAYAPHPAKQRLEKQDMLPLMMLLMYGMKK